MADDEDPSDGLTLDGTRVNHVVLTGEVVRDAKAKSGWALEITAANESDQEETAEVETELQRLTTNPMSRASPAPTLAFKKKETLTVPAGGKITRSYDVPAAIAAQITVAKKAEAAREKAAAQGKDFPPPRLITTFEVAFEGKWSDNAESASSRMMAFRRVAIPSPFPIRRELAPVETGF
jgi:hypothetical protein